MVLKYLSDEEQTLYYLKEELGLTYKEISRIKPFKGVKVDTLKKRRQYYIQKLIDALEMESYTFQCIKAKPKMPDKQ